MPSNDAIDYPPRGELRRTAVSSSYTATINDELIAVTDTSSYCVISLPAASAFPNNKPLHIVDESGNCSVKPITIMPDGDDTVNGVTGAFGINLDNASGAIYSDGANWHVLGASYIPIIPFHGPEVDGKIVGNTLLTITYNAAGKYYFPMFVAFRVTQSSGLVTTCTVSIGTNSTPYNNIRAAGLMVTTSENKWIQHPVADQVVDAVAPNTEIYVRVSIAAVATAYKFRPSLFGYYSS